ncbi:MAG: DUF885 domain-containing protein [Gammaproteobacteria bacterium]|nr:DUF885 domain-containing protein [Gammaproteobacteria bacterium]
MLALGAAPLQADPTSDFSALVADFDAHEKARDPISTGRDGDLEALGQWPDGSPGAVERRLELERGFRDRLRAIDRDDLDARDQVSHRVLAYLLDSRLMLGRFQSQRIPFTNDSGFFSTPIRLANSTRPRSVAEAEAWVRRLNAIPEFLQGHLAWMEQGVATGFVPPEPVVREVIDQIRTIAEAEADHSEMLAPLTRLPASVPESERQRLQQAALEAVADRALPAYRHLLSFLEQDYLAEPRQSLGISEVPNGRDYYQALVHYHTTLQISPEEIHKRGLSEVQRIRAEMDAVIETTGFDGSFEAFLDYLRSDPRFYAETPEELLTAASRIAKLADDAMPAFFRKLPRLPYGIRPVPDSMAPQYTTARYWPGNLEAGEAGGYMVNTYALDQRPLYELPALTLHEAVPGHHHQIALAQDMGIYRTPYEHFGRLTYEMWRACRLVVDTGLHWYGWSREEAEACFLENSALAPHNIRTEVSRYIAWPGQALAYKSGELLIRALRQEAEATLGDRFDLRAFHDRLLDEGAMPLSAVEAKMRAWIREQNDTIESS